MTPWGSNVKLYTSPIKPLITACSTPGPPWSLLFGLHRPKILVPSFVSFSHLITSSSKMSHKSHRVTSLLQCFPINSDKNPSLPHGFQGRIDSQHCSQTSLWLYCVSLSLTYLPCYHSWNISNVIHLRAFALACASDQNASPLDVSMVCFLTSSSHCWIFSHPASTDFSILFYCIWTFKITLITTWHIIVICLFSLYHCSVYFLGAILFIAGPRVCPKHTMYSLNMYCEQN